MIIPRSRFVRAFKRGHRFYCLVCDGLVSSLTQMRCPRFLNDSSSVLCLCRYSESGVIEYSQQQNDKVIFDNTKDIIISTLIECNGKHWRCNKDCRACNFTVAKNVYEGVLP